MMNLVYVYNKLLESYKLNFKIPTRLVNKFLSSFNTIARRHPKPTFRIPCSSMSKKYTL